MLSAIHSHLNAAVDKLLFARRSMPYELKILMWNVSTFQTKFDVEKADGWPSITKRIENEVLTPSFPFPPGLLFANDGCEAQSIRERVVSWRADRKSTRLNSSHLGISYA